MLQKARNFALYHVERDLKYKTNIPGMYYSHQCKMCADFFWPVPDAYTLVGVADVHEVLQEGEIYGKPII